MHQKSFSTSIPLPCKIINALIEKILFSPSYYTESARITPINY
ncbi:hypothetical protein SLEP1_g34986 [Rubroshorea leprosula]|uniref:Uncharacterized protein n=1 Tax=Rubroshorea leprosula TaxID=152421 RepID=A0AAV5KM75_9ROSI|nr:hypothetical protein SLEP1_g34986 [Rubroshorea leprosula]